MIKPACSPVNHWISTGVGHQGTHAAAVGDLRILVSRAIALQPTDVRREHSPISVVGQVELHDVTTVDRLALYCAAVDEEFSEHEITVFNLHETEEAIRVEKFDGALHWFD